MASMSLQCSLSMGKSRPPSLLFVNLDVLKCISEHVQGIGDLCTLQVSSHILQETIAAQGGVSDEAKSGRTTL